jgi:DNA replication protein DnaC
MLKDDLITELKRLRLPAMADNLDVRASQAEEGKLGYLEFTQLLVQDELASRESNSFQKRLKSAGVSNRMTFETFDFEFSNAVFPAQTIRDLASFRSIYQHRNLVLAGPLSRSV